MKNEDDPEWMSVTREDCLAFTRFLLLLLLLLLEWIVSRSPFCRLRTAFEIQVSGRERRKQLTKTLDNFC